MNHKFRFYDERRWKKRHLLISNRSRRIASLPFTDVIDSRSLHYNHVKLLLQTTVVDVLKAPIVIVIVVVAKELRARFDFPPHASIESHSHVVLARDLKRLVQR